MITSREQVQQADHESRTALLEQEQRATNEAVRNIYVTLGSMASTLDSIHEDMRAAEIRRDRMFERVQDVEVRLGHTEEQNDKVCKELTWIKRLVVVSIGTSLVAIATATGLPLSEWLKAFLLFA